MRLRIFTVMMLLILAILFLCIVLLLRMPDFLSIFLVLASLPTVSSSALMFSLRMAAIAMISLSVLSVGSLPLLVILLFQDLLTSLLGISATRLMRLLLLKMRRCLLLVIRNAYVRNCAVPVPSGTPYRDKKIARRNSHGSLELVLLEEVNQYNEIQSFRDGVSLDTLLARYRRDGDSSVFEIRQGVYADVSGFPRTYADAERVFSDLSATFDAIDPDLRGDLSFGDLLAEPAKLRDIFDRAVEKSNVEEDSANA